MKKTRRARQEPGIFTHETVRFLADLEANSTRDWFAANQAVYERAVKMPAPYFCMAMQVRLETLTGQPYSAKIYRIHRDVRFLKDTTPYNAHLPVSFNPRGPVAVPSAWFVGD